MDIRILEMFNKFKNLFIPIICLLIGVWIGMYIKKYQLQSEYSSQAPRKMITINNIDDDNREWVFDSLSHFANDNAFAIRIVTFLPDGEGDTTIFSMWRNDVRISGQEVGAIPGVLKIGFYDTERLFETPDWVYEKLAKDLIENLEEIPNIEVEK